MLTTARRIRAKFNPEVGWRTRLGTYTSRYNRRHKEFGHLFSGRYKALIEWGSEQTFSTFRCEEARGKAEIGKAESRNRNAEDRSQRTGEDCREGWCGH